MIKQLVLCLFSFCMVSSVLASEKHYFSDDTTLNVSISRNNLNRLFVRQDKITELKFPNNSLVLSGGKEGSIDKSGSLYLSAINTHPVTVYLGTESGHHVALVVSTMEGTGKTLELIPKRASNKLARWEQSTPYEDTLMSMMKALHSPKVPKGFGQVRPSTRRIFIKHKGFIQAKRVINGRQLQGIVYQFKNTTRHTVSLNEQDFSHRGVRAVMLSQHQVAPHQSTWVYVAQSNKERA